jgi:hypothetical protein
VEMSIKICRPEGGLYKNLRIQRFSPPLWKGQRVHGKWGNKSGPAMMPRGPEGRSAYGAGF